MAPLSRWQQLWDKAGGTRLETFALLGSTCSSISSFQPRNCSDHKFLGGGANMLLQRPQFCRNTCD